MTQTLSTAVRFMMRSGHPDLVYRLARELFHHARQEPRQQPYSIPIFSLLLLYGVAYLVLTFVMIGGLR